MQFKVPQFLDIEDKIFGPFTFRQFIYLVGGAGLCFVFYKTMPWYFSIFLILPVGGLAAALTFYQVNNKPFIFILESAIKYAFASKLYIWKKRLSSTNNKEEIAERKSQETEMLRTNKLGTSRLKDLTWSLDVLDIKKDKNTI